MNLLQRSLEQNRLAHAYLFTGTDTFELEAMARTLAKTLDCQNPKRGANDAAIDCCDKCPNCRRVDEDNHPDVLWVRPESKSRVIKIDQIVMRPTSKGRPLVDSVYLKPTSARYKIGVVVSADRLNQEAANAFLKTLEEPPRDSVLILLTTEPQRMLETIISRCLRLNFAGERKLSEAELAWLSSFAQIATDPKGGLLGRYRLLDVLAKKLAEMKEAIEENLQAKSALERYDELDPKLRDRLEEELAAAVEAEYRRQRTDLLVALQIWLRDVWLGTVSIGDELMTLSQLKPNTEAIAKRISTADAISNLQVMEQTQRLLQTNIQEALALEVGFLKLKL